MNKSKYDITTKKGQWYFLNESQSFRLAQLQTMQQQVVQDDQLPLLLAYSSNAGVIAVATKQLEQSDSYTVHQKSNWYNHIKFYTTAGVACRNTISLSHDNTNKSVHYLTWINTVDHLLVFTDNTKITIYTYDCQQLQDNSFVLPGATLLHTPTRNGIFFVCAKNDVQCTLCLLQYTHKNHSYKLNQIALSNFTLTAHALNLLSNTSSSSSNVLTSLQLRLTNSSFLPTCCTILPLANNDANMIDTPVTKCFVSLLQTYNEQQYHHILQCTFSPSRNEMIQLKISIQAFHIYKWSLSPNEKYLALLTQRGLLYLTNHAFDVLTQIISIPIDTETILHIDWLSNTSICYLQQQSDIVDDTIVNTCQLHFWHIGALVNEQTKVNTKHKSSLHRNYFSNNCDRSNNNVEGEQKDYDKIEEVEEVIDGLDAHTLCSREIDGVRLLSAKRHMFLQFVPQYANRVFALGSQYSSSKLINAFDKFMLGDPAAVHLISSLKNNRTELARAIEDCVQTAKWQFDVQQQKRLLRVAALGKSLYQLYDTNTFVSSIQSIRFRHTLHTSPLKLVLSDKQLDNLGGERLIKRLVMLEQFNYAITCAQVFGVEQEQILHTWAMLQLTKHDKRIVNQNVHVSQTSLVKKVLTKLTKYAHFSYVKLALQLHKRGKRRAALTMLENDKIYSRQVSALLSISEPQAALQKAVQSHNTDLIFVAVQFLLQTRKTNAIDLIISFPQAKAILEQLIMLSTRYKQLLKSYKHDKLLYVTIQNDLMRYFYYESKLKQQGQRTHDTKVSDWWDHLQDCKRCTLDEAIAQVNTQSINAHSIKATITTGTLRDNSANMLSTIHSSINQHKLKQTNLQSHKGVNTALNQQANEVGSVLHFAQSVSKEQSACMRQMNDDRFLSGSVSQIIQYAFEHGKTNIAERLRKQFNVPDAMFMWSMLRGYAQTNQWDALDSAVLARIRLHDAFDTEPVITTLLQYNRFNQARQYIPRVANADRRMQYYVTCGDWKRAAEDCKQQRDAELLSQLRQRARGNADALQQINNGWDGALETRIDLKKLFL